MFHQGEIQTELIKNLLEKRGITNETAAEIFLNPDYKRDIHDPYLMRDMERACVRLYEAIEHKEKIVIYADYDCDGIPGAVILEDLFKLVGYKNFEVYIPKRNSEGYGLNIEAIKQFGKDGVKLVITIDLGITAVAEVAQAEVLGLDVIITDHHLPHLSEAGQASELPRAYAILNPKVDKYPEKNLCGAGVVFKFVQGFLKKYREYFKIKEGSEKWMLDMAGLATMADRVPLTGENRAISYFGLKVLRRSPRPGLQKLLAHMNIEQKSLSEDDLSFMVIPKLNAASRMDDPRHAYELLSTLDVGRAGVLTEHLSRINEERKHIVTGIMREVNKRMESWDLTEREIIVIGNPAWRVGTLGLVAGKISDLYERPVFVWGKDENDCIKGSCRSDGSVNLVELMTHASESFSEFGGHELAGGFTVVSEKIHFLEEVLTLSYTKVKRSKVEEGAIYDLKSDLGLVNMKNWQEIERLAPFGLGNPKPVFLFENVKIEKIRSFGKKNGGLARRSLGGGGEHLEIVFRDSSENKAKAISFFSGPESFSKPLTEGLRVNLLANFDLSRHRGKEELRLRIVDIM